MDNDNVRDLSDLRETLREGKFYDDYDQGWSDIAMLAKKIEYIKELEAATESMKKHFADFYDGLLSRGDIEDTNLPLVFGEVDDLKEVVKIMKEVAERFK